MVVRCTLFLLRRQYLFLHRKSLHTQTNKIRLSAIKNAPANLNNTPLRYKTLLHIRICSQIMKRNKDQAIIKQNSRVKILMGLPYRHTTHNLAYYLIYIEQLITIHQFKPINLLSKRNQRIYTKLPNFILC